MSSPSNTTSVAPPRYSTTTPPPYTASDTDSVASGKSTSKSILAKMFNRKSSEATPSQRNDVQKKVDDDLNKHVARASYYATR